MALCQMARGQSPQTPQTPSTAPSSGDLTQVSIENLMNMEVTSVSKKGRAHARIAARSEGAKTSRSGDAPRQELCGEGQPREERIEAGKIDLEAADFDLRDWLESTMKTLALRDARDPSASLRILLAEDNAVNQRLAVRLLEKRGHHVVVAANGRAALDALDKENFDLVFMDVQMPEMDGHEASAAIRAKEKVSGLHQQIVALTAHAMKGDREKCLASGMDHYLVKPIRPPELDEILEEIKAHRLAPVVTLETTARSK